MPRLSGAVLLLCLAAAAASAQDPQAERRVAEAAGALADTALVPAGRGDTVILPVLGYTPDTGLMLGGFALRLFYLDPPSDEARPSAISPVVIYTLKNQWLVFLGTDLNWGDGRWHAGLVPGYQKFPDDYYGIGRDTPVDPLENYTPEQFSFEGMIEREVLGELRLGLGYRVAKHQLLEIEPGGVMAGGLPGAEKSVLSAPGLLAAWDTRDNTWAPRRGLWAQTGVSFYREGWGSDYRFTEHSADLRGYLPVGGTGTLAGQFLYRSLDGTAPFYHLPRLGGEGGLLGYGGGRFIDRTMTLARAEWRSGPVLGRFGGVLFAGVGDVAPRPGGLTTAAGLTTFGLGLRWAVSPEEKVNIRMDFGFGKDDSGFFLSLGEVF
ncbi:MAG: BamA/TamA family outer membrane protein [Krumholzibacteria bacterium]|nr:BamA/TamA family outer membrane protein [Candidatus Krumholzibacteria bacterium]